MIKVKWKTVWYPLGEWRDENGVKVEKPGNFFCDHNGNVLICVMVPTEGPQTQEKSHTAPIPHFIRADNLESYNVPDEDYITVETWTKQ